MDEGLWTGCMIASLRLSCWECNHTSSTPAGVSGRSILPLYQELGTWISWKDSALETGAWILDSVAACLNAISKNDTFRLGQVFNS